MNEVNLYFNPSILQRRRSLFKPSLRDDIILKNAVQKFISQCQKKNLWESNAPITWQRLSSGFRITDLEIDRMEEILELLKTYYFCTNESCLATSLYMDTKKIKTYQQFILDSVADNSSFCAIEEGTGKIVGVAIASLKYPFDEGMETSHTSLVKDIFNVLEFKNDLLSDANIYERYNVDKYFCISVVCTIRDYYGMGIGTSLIRSCLTRAVTNKYPLCIGIFPAGPCYTIAQKLGFQIIAEMKWINIRSTNKSGKWDSKDISDVENSVVGCMAMIIPIEHKEEKLEDTIC